MSRINPLTTLIFCPSGLCSSVSFKPPVFSEENFVLLKFDTVVGGGSCGDAINIISFAWNWRGLEFLYLPASSQPPEFSYFSLLEFVWICKSDFICAGLTVFLTFYCILLNSIEGSCNEGVSFLLCFSNFLTWVQLSWLEKLLRGSILFLSLLEHLLCKDILLLSQPPTVNVDSARLSPYTGASKELIKVGLIIEESFSVPIWKVLFVLELIIVFITLLPVDFYLALSKFQGWIVSERALMSGDFLAKWYCSILCSYWSASKVFIRI